MSEEVRIIRFCDVVEKLGVPIHEGEQLRVLMSGIRQVSRAAITMIIPSRKWRRGEDCGVKCREDSVKRKRFAEHIEQRHPVEWKRRKKKGWG